MLKDEQRTWTSPLLKGQGEPVQFGAKLWKPSTDASQPACFTTSRNSRPRAGDWDTCEQATHLDVDDPPAKVKQLVALHRWHLCDVRHGPLHYVANAAYWWKYHLHGLGVVLPRKQGWDIDYGDWARNHIKDAPLDVFKRHVVYGCVEEVGLPETKFTWPPRPDEEDSKAWNAGVAACHALVDEAVKTWCEARFEGMMAAFERDMVDFWGEDVRVT